MMRERARRFLLCNWGATAVEFALVMPAFLALVLGGLSVSVLMYSNVSLQVAAERGARCFSVDTATCNSPSAAQTYAQGFYHGVGAPTFTASTPPCGHQVARTLTLQIAAVLVNLSVPLTASACFPPCAQSHEAPVELRAFPPSGSRAFIRRATCSSVSRAS